MRKKPNKAVTKRTKKGREEIEHRYNALFNRSIACVYVQDLKGKFVDVNNAMLELLGYNRKELISLDFQSLLSKEQIPLASKCLKEVTETGSQKHVSEFKLKCKNESYVYAQTEAVLIYRNGKPFLIQGIARDITERKQFRQILREWEDKYKHLFENSLDLLVCITPSGNIIDINSSALKAIGYSKKEVVGKQFSEFVPSKYISLLSETLASQVAGESIPPIETEIRSKQGDLINVEFAPGSIPLYTAGKLIGVVVAAKDISERKKAEEERMAVALEREAFIDAMADSLIVLSPDGKIVFANEPHLKKFGHKSLDEIKGVSIAELSKAFVNPEEDLPKILKLFAEMVKKGVAMEQPVEIQLKRQDGKQQFLVSATASVVKDVNGNTKKIVTILRDITSMKQLEKETMFSERMATVGQLAAGVSHEFNNLMTVIRSSAQTAKRTQEDTDVKEHIKKTLDCVDRGTRIATDLLSFSKPVNGKKQKSDLVESIEDTLALVNGDLTKNKIKVVKKFKKIPRLSVDKGQIQQVFLNLIINAKQAMIPKGGKLTISAGRKNGAASIQFNNTGKTIEKKYIDRVFDPFFTTKGALGHGNAPGSGLGLSVSYGIIQAHGGTITVKSNSGSGTTFTIKLPVKGKGR